MRKAAPARAGGAQTVQTQENMKYIDLHCDALTQEGVLQVTKQRLQAGGCLLQCFAAFVGGGGFARFLRLADAFDAMCLREGYHRAENGLVADGVNAMLTVEGDALEGDIGRLDALYARGVRIMGFVWNTPASLGYPNFPDYAGLCAGRVPFCVRETRRGLTPFGREALVKMQEMGMLADVSHASDALFWEVAARRRPFVATHAGAAAVHDVARNLTNAQIAALADCGGVIGLDFCADFLSEDTTAFGQREAMLAHAKAIVAAGGEDVLALGSDFDGIPANAYVPDPSYMPRFLEALSAAIGARAAQKAARDNVLRLFHETICK